MRRNGTHHQMCTGRLEFVAGPALELKCIKALRVFFKVSPPAFDCRRRLHLPRP